MRLGIFLALALVVDAAEITGSVRQGGRPVAQAIVYLGDGTTRWTNSAPVVVEARGGVLRPRVQIASRDAALVLRNADPTLHIVQIEALSATNRPAPVLTQAMPYAGFQKAFALTGFRETTLLRITAGNGEDMDAYVAVLPHPWAALTDASGRFVLREVPSGAHRLFVWHEKFGALTREVRVNSARPAPVDLAFR